METCSTAKSWKKELSRSFHGSTMGCKRMLLAEQQTLRWIVGSIRRASCLQSVSICHKGRHAQKSSLHQIPITRDQNLCWTPPLRASTTWVVPVRSNLIRSKCPNDGASVHMVSHDTCQALFFCLISNKLLTNSAEKATRYTLCLSLCNGDWVFVCDCVLICCM